MKIGVFDSGIGGLIILKSIVKALPQYDYLYLGDTKHVPYGDRSQEEIYKFTKQALDYLFRNDCKLVILACNTASTRALRKLQREYLPKYYPDRKVLGVIVPTVETAAENKRLTRVGVLATRSTIISKAYIKEFKKINPQIKVYNKAAPLLVPMIEIGDTVNTEKVLNNYLQSLLNRNIRALILGCTHYGLLKSDIKKILGKRIKVISQDENVPGKLKMYLKNHSEISNALSMRSSVDLRVTSLNDNLSDLVKRWFSGKYKLSLIKL